MLSLMRMGLGVGNPGFKIHITFQAMYLNTTVMNSLFEKMETVKQKHRNFRQKTFSQ